MMINQSNFKILFIANGHTGSTLPLAKQFLRWGYHVDYCIVTGNAPLEFEALNVKLSYSKSGLFEIEMSEAKELFTYMNNPNFRLFRICQPRPFLKVPIFRSIKRMLIKHFYRNVCNTLKTNNYTTINLIGRYDSFFFIYFLQFIKHTTILTSLHEVCHHYEPDFNKPSKLLDYLIKNEKPIIVHSLKSLNDVLKFKGINKKNVDCINFGLFDTYSYIHEDIDIIVPNRYFLFLGYLKPYKGLNVLYNAVSYHKSSFINCKIVVAGAGNNEVLEKMKNDDTFIIYNRFIKNEELVTLIKKSLAVICPYVSISQSGIVQTCFVFNKPVIASKLGSFTELIDDGKFGYLINVNDSEDLFEKMNRFIENKELASSMETIITNFLQYKPEYSWDTIVQQYILLPQKRT